MKHNHDDDNIWCTGIPINENTPFGGFNIAWDGPFGFGQFDVIFDKDGKAHFYTEYMSNKTDKEFAYLMVEKMIDEAIVEE